MAIRKETELKYRLEGAEAYRRLCDRLGPPVEEWDQINHYYQSADGQIPGRTGVIRIRAEKGRVLFTVKLEGILENGLARAVEMEIPWKGEGAELPPRPEALWEAAHPGMESLAAEHRSRIPLVRVGEMINRRKVYPLSGGLTLEVDESRYPDGETDHEVELETEDPDRDRIRLTGLLDAAGVSYSPQTETKYQRFLRHRM